LNIFFEVPDGKKLKLAAETGDPDMKT